MQSADKLSDEQLVERVRLVDQELYAQVVKRYEDKLWRYVATILVDDAMVADIVQETFIKAYINLRGFDTRRKFSSWLYRIAHNEAVNILKKQRRKVAWDENVERLIYSHGAMEEEMSRRELMQAMQDSMQRLPLLYREPLALFYGEEKSYEDISDILRLPMGTVATRISRGKKLLRMIYEKNH